MDLSGVKRYEHVPFNCEDDEPACWGIPEEFTHFSCPRDNKSTPFNDFQIKKLSDICLPLMVSLAEVLDVGDVTWSGHTNETNDFAVKLKNPYFSLSKFVRNKVGFL